MTGTDEDLEIGLPRVRRLVDTQLPHWRHLPLTPVESSGTDHVLYRLGDELCVRLPRAERTATQGDKEERWLPVLGPLLPLAIPRPRFRGEPAEGYPFRWSVYEWFQGENAWIAPVTDRPRAARQLARFVTTLRGIDASDGPHPGPHNFFRGVPLAERDAPTLAALAEMPAEYDRPALADAWQSALDVPRWDRAPVWVHGDIHGGNLLVERGEITSVIDFGGLGVGDPAVDLLVAWNFLDADERALFRDEVKVDDATWVRGRGWALSMSLIALPYYLHTNPEIAGMAARTIDAVLADREAFG